MTLMRCLSALRIIKQVTLIAAMVFGLGQARAEVHFDVLGRGLDCSLDPCRDVFPGAHDFRAVDEQPWVEVLDETGAVIGWLALSTEVVSIKGYSGKPLATLVGLDKGGRITGARVIYHSEPILLVGIPEEELTTWVDSYRGRHAEDRLVVGGKAGEEHTVDIISGATVTVLAENRTIMETAVGMGEVTGVIETRPRTPGHFIEDEQPWSWQQLVDRGALGHLRISQEEMGLKPPADGSPFLEVWFGVVDAPGPGRSLLGDRVYQRARDQLLPGEHLVAIYGWGVSSFKGSGFVRGGVFDRVRIEQGLRTIMFRDSDYINMGQPRAPGAPYLKEGALFVTRDNQLDPGAPWDLVILGSRFTLNGGIEREFRTFRVEHRTPRSVYVLDGPDPESLVWRQAWKRQALPLACVLIYLTLISLVFIGRRWSAASLRRLKRLQRIAMVSSFVGLGLILSLQPSVTQLLTLIGSVVGEWRWGLFLSDPLLFVTWLFIAGTSLIWGRGVFCGWVCPYGALSDLINDVGKKLKLPQFNLPEVIHLRARFIRYLVLGLLVVTYLVSPEWGERLAEVEPFKSTFFVLPWTRSTLLFLWWGLLAGVALVWWRPFCRYICPLGAALALPSSFRISSPYRREFCSRGCKICPQSCEPRAFREDGSIDPRECLGCWECEATYNDQTRCPPLIQIRRKKERKRGPSTGGQSKDRAAAVGRSA